MHNRIRHNTGKVSKVSHLAMIAATVLAAAVILGQLTNVHIQAKDSSKKEFVLDSSGQRNAIIEAQKKTNAKLDEIISLLKSGQVKVQVVEKKSTAAGGSGNDSAGT